VSVARGREGEARAEAYLSGLGWTILERNRRAPGGEVDLIGRDGRTMVFVEVKQRASRGFGGAAASVGAVKRRRIAKCAVFYLRGARHDGPIRFDVIAIEGESLRHIPSAFRAEGFTR